MEAVDLRLQVVVEHRLEGRHLRVHDEDVGGDARLAQLRAFVGHGHGQIIHAVLLEGLGHFVRASAVGRCLHHAGHLHAGTQEGAVVVEVLHQRAEIDFEDGLVHLLLQQFGQGVEAEAAGTLDEDNLPRKPQLSGAKGSTKCLGVGKEDFLHPEVVSVGGQLLPHPDDALHVAALQQLGHLAIEQRAVLPRLEQVGEDERALQVVGEGAAIEEVEGDVQRGEVRTITVVDKQAAILALLHLQTHGHRLQTRHTLGDVGRRHHQVEAGGQTVQGVLDRGIVNERQGVGVVHVQVAVVDDGVVLVLLHLTYI